VARWVLYPETIDTEIDGGPLLKDLADDVVVDARGYAHEETGELRAAIHATDVEGDSIYVVADPVHPDEPGDEGHYGYWAEVGTSDTPAQRFLEKALYRRRNP
jgi:hypothetical protein